MSRIDAALRRARTGVVAPQEPVKRRQPAAPPPAAPPRPSRVPPPTPAAPPPDAPRATARSTRDAPVHAASRESRSRPPDSIFRGFSPEHVEKLVIADTMPQPMRETYRRLAATLHHAQADHNVKLLMVSSAVPNEGKTLTAVNIALTLSESFERRVLLIDADLRRPSIHSIFQVSPGPGLHEALGSVPERDVPLVPVSAHLSLLTGGAPDPDPMSLLTSGRMRRLLSEAAESFEWVIIDTPPVGILTDAKLLGSFADAALLVVRAGSTSSALVQKAVDALGRERIIGVMLNRTELRHSTGAYYGGGYYYDYSSTTGH